MQDTKPKPFVFVLMPFHESFDDVYQLGIKPACQAAGAYCERVDEQIFQESILERTYNQIAKADLIVSDMSGRNPNVFYETGYAHALGKKVILLTHHSEDIPFDLKHYPHIIYGGKIAFLKEELERRVSWYIEQPIIEALEPHSQLKFFIGGQEISDGGKIIIPHDECHPDRDDLWSLKAGLAVHNPSNRLIDARFLSVALIFPPTARSYSADPGSVRLPDGRLLTRRRPLVRMYPKDWHRVTLNAYLHGKAEGVEITPCVLRIFGPTGVTDIPFYFEPTEPRQE
ncbi:MAG: hypothetical protein H8D43_03935 [Chloroflexi bacterium]|nr:hypothetical protein [Chloroflexota bacterium]